jgi:hypothetical protein
MREMTGSVPHFITRQSSHTWKYPNFSSRKVGNQKLLLKVKIPDKPSITCYLLNDVKPVGRQSWAPTMEKQTTVDTYNQKPTRDNRQPTPDNQKPTTTADSNTRRQSTIITRH